jgi:hypothetical protein
MRQLPQVEPRQSVSGIIFIQLAIVSTACVSSICGEKIERETGKLPQLAWALLYLTSRIGCESRFLDG